MKTATLLIFFMFPFLAFGSQVTCIENSAPAGQPQRQMVLRQIGGSEPLQEQLRYPFELELSSGTLAEPVVLPVTVTTVDVIVNFATEDGQVTGVVFKDEPDQSALYFNGED